MALLHNASTRFRCMLLRMLNAAQRTKIRAILDVCFKDLSILTSRNLDISFFLLHFVSLSQSEFSSTSKMARDLLGQADGYGIIIGLSVLFCLIILVAVRIQKRYLSEDSDHSEMFMVANRSVGTGLTASAVFSSWSVHTASEP